MSNDTWKDCCVDCGESMPKIKEPMISLIKTEIKNKLGLPSGTYTPLCLGCFEKRIGRELRPSDIEATYNWWINEKGSERLRGRLGKLIPVAKATKRSGHGRR
jgi:hypothetical protein